MCLSHNAASNTAPPSVDYDEDTCSTSTKLVELSGLWLKHIENATVANKREFMYDLMRRLGPYHFVLLPLGRVTPIGGEQDPDGFDHSTAFKAAASPIEQKWIEKFSTNRQGDRRHGGGLNSRNETTTPQSQPLPPQTLQHTNSTHPTRGATSAPCTFTRISFSDSTPITRLLGTIQRFISSDSVTAVKALETRVGNMRARLGISGVIDLFKGQNNARLEDMLRWIYAQPNGASDHPNATLALHLYFSDTSGPIRLSRAHRPIIGIPYLRPHIDNIDFRRAVADAAWRTSQAFF